MIIAIIQARTGSTRLPNKVLKELPQGSGVSVLARIIRRLKKCRKLDNIIVATAENNQPVVDIAMQEKAPFYVHNGEDDVLGRFFQVSQLYRADVIVRITADCPAVMPEMVDKMIAAHLTNQSEFTFNRNDNLTNCTEIDGLDIEIFNEGILREAHQHAFKPDEREHVTKWLYDHCRPVIVESAFHIKNNGDIKLSIDTGEDYERLCRIFKELGDDFGVKELTEYLEKEQK